MQAIVAVGLSGVVDEGDSRLSAAIHITVGFDAVADLDRVVAADLVPREAAVRQVQGQEDLEKSRAAVVRAHDARKVVLRIENSVARAKGIVGDGAAVRDLGAVL